MSGHPESTTWHADPHTLAKIKIIGRYLYRWAVITGRTFKDQPLTYIDGFAGPGEYKNAPDGSPVVALAALNAARSDTGTSWIAGDIRVMFVEQVKARYDHLRALIKNRGSAGGVKYLCQNCSFVEGLASAENSFSKAFYTSAPLLVFIDPFRATGFPWHAVAKILSSRTSEIILNFDADGIARIAKAGESANASQILTTILGGRGWQAELSSEMTTSEMERRLVDLYKRKLLSLPNVRYAFAFEMASHATSIDYFLLFASQNWRGLEKMKEVMKEIDQTGEFRFSDADIAQQRLIRFDEPADWVPKLTNHFSGETVSYDVVHQFTLNETPLINPSKMLYAAQESGLLSVECYKGRAKRNSFKREEIKSITFKEAKDG